MTLILALVSGLTWSSSTAACSCGVPPPETAAAEAEAVLFGVVTDLEVRRPWWDYFLEFMEIDHVLDLLGIAREPPDPLYLEAQFRILYSWKEPSVDSTSFKFRLSQLLRRVFGAEDHVVTLRTDAWCFSAFDPEPEDEYYLVYARKDPFHVTEDNDSETLWPEGPLWTLDCDGTAPLEFARYDLLVLGNPQNDYRLPGDTVLLPDPMSLSEEETREILSWGVWRTAGLIVEVSERTSSDDYAVWFRPNHPLQGDHGRIDGRMVDAGDWQQVNEALRRLGSRLWESYRSHD